MDGREHALRAGHSDPGRRFGPGIPSKGLTAQKLISTGGVQPYLQLIFGPVFGFLAAWTWIVAVMPATLAILSIVFVETVFSAAGVTDQAGRIEHKLLSVLVLVAITVANSISTKASTRLGNFFVVTKFISIAGVVVAGLAVVIIQVSAPDRADVGGRDWFERPWFGYRDSTNPDGSITHWGELSQWDAFGHYSAALYGALWAYSGWDKVSFSTGPAMRSACLADLAGHSRYI